AAAGVVDAAQSQRIDCEAVDRDRIGLKRDAAADRAGLERVDADPAARLDSCPHCGGFGLACAGAHPAALQRDAACDLAVGATAANRDALVRSHRLAQAPVVGEYVAQTLHVEIEVAHRQALELDLLLPECKLRLSVAFALLPVALLGGADLRVRQV